MFRGPPTLRIKLRCALPKGPARFGCTWMGAEAVLVEYKAGAVEHVCMSKPTLARDPPPQPPPDTAALLAARLLAMRTTAR